MPAVLLTALWQALAGIGFKLLLTGATKLKIVNKLDAAGIAAAHDVTSAVMTLKTYQTYPTGRNGQGS
jgi:hypothetical protein